jgi:hypothetical protein
VNLDERKIDLILDGQAEINRTINKKGKGKAGGKRAGKAKDTKAPLKPTTNKGKRKPGPVSKRTKGSRSKPKR